MQIKKIHLTRRRVHDIAVFETDVPHPTGRYPFKFKMQWRYSVYDKQQNESLLYIKEHFPKVELVIQKDCENIFHFEGIVQEVVGDVFDANIIDVDTHDEIFFGGLKFDIIPDDERQYIQEGAVFYWNIVDKIETIHFPEPKIMTQEMLDKAEASARRLYAKFKV